MKLTFCGAAGIVTGSCYLLETGRDKILVDCGMFQGSKDITRHNYMPFRFNPASITHVVLTHAHIDHSGLLPKLVRDGFRGKITGTGATVDLCAALLEDSANVQRQETESENRRRARLGEEPREPIYTEKDVRKTLPRFERTGYGTPCRLSGGVEAVFRDAGHILGSAIVELFVTEKGRSLKLVFSGDIGQWNVPLMNDPTLVEEADCLLIESTYGDRTRREGKDREAELLRVVKETFNRGGRLLIPSFSVERTQELLFSFNRFIKKGEFPDQKIFLDSPLAIRATEIFQKHGECLDREALEVFGGKQRLPNLVYSMTPQDSMKLNGIEKPCIIVAGSGMCNAGRIRHHLKHGLWNPKNTVLFVGYQANGTLGRVILDGAREVRMMGIVVAVRANIEKIDGFSAHADAEELMKWAGGFTTRKPARTFVVHGEPKAAEALGARLSREGFNARVPELGESAEL
jgi:metallo-beta-lactamase family protein